MKANVVVVVSLIIVSLGSILAQTPADPEPAMGVPAAASAAQDPSVLTVPVGTRLQLVLNNFISSKDSRNGDTFYAIVDYPIFIGNTPVIPADSLIRGTVVQSEKAGRIRGRSYITLQFDSLVLINGVTKQLSAEIFAINDASEVALLKGGTRLEGPSTKERDIVAAATMGAEGAAVGAIAGGGKGLAIGSAAGGIAGLTYLLAVRGEDIYLDRGLAFELILKKPIELTAQEVDFSKAPVSPNGGRSARTDYRPRDRYPDRRSVPVVYPRHFGVWISGYPYYRRPWY